MRIKITGLVLCIVMAVIMGVFISMGFEGWMLTSPSPTTVATRFVLPDSIITVIQSLSNMLWHFRGIDLVLQGVFLFVAALAASVFFQEVDMKEE
jgi:hypothetical protein